MIDKVQKIREEVERIQLYTQSEVLKKVLDYIDEEQKEPASEELEEASLRASIIRGQRIPKEYLDEYPYDAYAQSMFKRGAQWQKEQMTSKAIDAKVEADLDPYGADYGIQRLECEYGQLEALKIKNESKVKVIIIKEN